MDAVRHSRHSNMYTPMPNPKRARLDQPSTLPSIAELFCPGQATMTQKFHPGQFFYSCDNQGIQSPSVAAPIKVRESPSLLNLIKTHLSQSEYSPLGLTLRKSPSLLNLIQTHLSQSENSVSESGHKESNAEKGNPEKEKPKAANFPATVIQIGTWQRTSRYDGDLVGKCYYSKRKLVWEFLDNGLKSKMQIQWSDITALKALFQDGQPAILDMELSRPPLFFHETTPQPRKHSLWQGVSDFTDGQASTCRRHTLQFPNGGVFERHFEKLLRCDERLMMLSKQAISITTRNFPEKDHMYLGRNHQGLDYLGDSSNYAAFLPRAPNTGLQNIDFGSRNIVEPQHYQVPNMMPQSIQRLKQEPMYHHGMCARPPSSLQQGFQTPQPVIASPRSVIDAKSLDESSSSSNSNSEVDDFSTRDEMLCGVFDYDHMCRTANPTAALDVRSMFSTTCGPSNIQADLQQTLDSISIHLLGVPASIDNQRYSSDLESGIIRQSIGVQSYPHQLSPLVNDLAQLPSPHAQKDDHLQSVVQEPNGVQTYPSLPFIQPTFDPQFWDWESVI